MVFCRVVLCLGILTLLPTQGRVESSELSSLAGNSGTIFLRGFIIEAAFRLDMHRT